MASVLVVDDDRSVQLLVAQALRGEGVQVVPAATGKETLDLLKQRSFDVVLLDVLLPDIPGLDLYRSVQSSDPRLPVIFITMVGSSETAIEAMKLGAFDYLAKPLDLEKLREMVHQALEIRRLCKPVSLEAESPDAAHADLMIGNSPAMLEVYKTIGRVAPQDVPVLILGESGTGKELVARAIAQHSRRSKGPFLALNCAAIPESLLESELFGHEKGSFTGATTQRIGKFERSSGGTIFLDEIGDMPLLLQAKILRVLQDQQFERVGGSETIRTDVRVISATHRNLEQMSQKNQFRTDLLYRLKGVTIHLPPLRERQDDLPRLVEFFVGRFAREQRKENLAVSDEAMDLIRRYPWPGNIRELQSAVRFAVLQSKGSVMLPEFLPRELRDTSAGIASVLAASPHGDSTNATADLDFEEFVQDRLAAGTESLYAEALERMERQLLSSILRHSQGNQSRAAKLLGITRGSLRNKIRALGISIEPGVEIENDSPVST
jgi:two-component system nitrogen regulation response regulator GlnG